MADHDLHVERAEGHGLDGEEIRRPDVERVIAEERVSAQRRGASLRRVPVAPHRPDADVEPEHLQLAHKTGAPQRGFSCVSYWIRAWSSQLILGRPGRCPRLRQLQ